jgi:hypothetical protein
MKTRSLILAALGAIFVIGAVSPALADHDDWRRREWREHEWREHEWREHHHHHWHDGYNYGYYGPRW